MRGVTQFWRRYRANRLAVFGLACVLLLVAGAILGPTLAPRDPLQLGQDALAPPSRQYPFGTDDLGKDILSGVLYGARVSLAVGVLSGAVAMIIGVLVGAVAGYYGGSVDDLLMRITEWFLVIPQFLLILVIAAIVGASLLNVILVIGVLGWPATARLVRAQFLAVKRREFVEAARGLGAGDGRIIFRSILPNAIAPAVVASSLQMASAILSEAGLRFLGLGDPDIVSWGSMLYAAQNLLEQGWWTAVFPGMAIFIAVVGFNLVGDGINTALNPKEVWGRPRIGGIV